MQNIWREKTLDIMAVVAEWLRRLTRNQIPSGSVGSNPTDCETTLFISFHASRLTFEDAGRTQHRLHVRNVGSVVECSPATRAARVRFPDVAKQLFLVLLFYNKTRSKSCFIHPPR